ncbi:MAG: hypothetical protein GY789_18935 [Hyphomicrobiales bacterium]|nr:hypothetical protein [Hyphomicrobiales bacterium]MCP4998497.1 hypothetical protein [Hyphomicrobiales bacterium]
MSEVLVGIVLNGIQHIVTIGVGLMAVFLGYRLFIELPLRREGESKLDLPGGVSIMLSRIGPGIFFALFGAGMIIYSIMKPIEITDIAEQVATAEGATTVKRSRTLTGLGQQEAGSVVKTTAATIDRTSVIVRLNRIAIEAKANKSGSDLLDITIAIREAKLALVREVWEPQWGDYDQFHRWVTEQFEQNPPPEGLEDVATYFQQGR